MNDLGFLDRLLALPVQYYPTVARDGRHVAFARRGLGHGTQVYLSPLESGVQARRLTAPPGDAYPLSWSFDGSHLVVARSNDGDERDSLFLVDIRSGSETRLTRKPDDHFVSGGALHPNGRWLFYGATKDFATDRPVESTWLWRHDILNGDRLCLARPGGSIRASPQVSPIGDAVLYQRNDRDPGGRQLWLVSVNGTDDREIVNAGDRIQVSGSWSPDGSAIVVHANGPGHSRVGLWHRTDNAVHWLIDDTRRNVERAFWPCGSHRIVCIETHDAVSRGFLLDPVSGDEVPIECAAGGTLLPIAPTASGQWLGQWFDARHPNGFVLFDVAATSPELVPVAPSPQNILIAPAELAAPESVTWASSDGATVQGWLYRPGRPARGAVVAVHGGPTWHIENRLSALVQYLVHCGFAVLEPNYRGSTGFDPAWRDAIKDDGWGGREQDDIRGGIRMLIEAGIARPGCIGMIGLSYGGYSSWCAITRWPVSEIAAAAPVCGMTDLVVDYETTRPDLRAYSVEMMGGTPAQVPEKYRARSPINFVGNIRGELLIVQGMQDPNVTPENLAAVRKALDGAGVQYEVLTFDDEGHGIVKEANRRVLYSRLVDFFDRAFARSAVAG